MCVFWFLFYFFYSKKKRQNLKKSKKKYTINWHTFFCLFVVSVVVCGGDDWLIEQWREIVIWRDEESGSKSKLTVSNIVARYLIIYSNTTLHNWAPLCNILRNRIHSVRRLPKVLAPEQVSFYCKISSSITMCVCVVCVNNNNISNTAARGLWFRKCVSPLKKYHTNIYIPNQSKQPLQLLVTNKEMATMDKVRCRHCILFAISHCHWFK